MIDAYTIGITIALEDGVSAGVAAIKQDLLALDRAIQATAAGLLALRRLGEQVGTVGGGGSSTAASHAPSTLPPAGGAPPAPDAAPPLDTDVTPRPIPAPSSPPNYPAPPKNDARQQAIPTKPPLPVPEPVLQASQTRAASPVRSQPTAPADLPKPIDPEPAVQVHSIQLRPIADFAPRPLDARRELPLAAPAPDPLATEPVRPDPLPNAPVRDAEIISQRPLRLPRSASFLAAPAAPPARVEPPRQPAPASRETDIEPPVPGPRTTSPPRSAQETRSPPPRSSRQNFETPGAVPPSPRGDTKMAGLSGDIMLDGSRLGRWVSDSLTKMVERAPSGSTGVDPRASPGWPAIQTD